MVDGRCKSAPALVTSRVQVQTERATARGFPPILGPTCAGVIFTTRNYLTCKAAQLWVAGFALQAAVVLIRDVLLRSEIKTSRLCFFFFLSLRNMKGPVWQFRRKKQHTPVFAVQPQKTNTFHNSSLYLKHSDKHEADWWWCKISIILGDPSNAMRNVTKKTICAGRKQWKISFERHFCRTCRRQFVGRLWAKFTKHCKTEPQVDQSSHAKDLFPSHRVAKSSAATSWSYHEKTVFPLVYVNLKAFLKFPSAPQGERVKMFGETGRQSAKIKTHFWLFHNFLGLALSSKPWQFSSKYSTRGFLKNCLFNTRVRFCKSVLLNFRKSWLFPQLTELSSH